MEKLVLPEISSQLNIRARKIETTYFVCFYVMFVGPWGLEASNEWVRGKHFGLETWHYMIVYPGRDSGKTLAVKVSASHNVHATRDCQIAHVFYLFN